MKNDKQKDVEVYCILQYIKERELIPLQLDKLINDLIDYKYQVEKEILNYYEDTQNKDLILNQLITPCQQLD